MIGIKLLNKYLIWLIVILAFFENISIPLTVLNNSYRLMVGLLAGLILINFDHVLIFFKRDGKITAFLCLILVGLISGLSASYKKGVIDQLLLWLTGLFLYIYYGSKKLIKKKVESFLCVWLGLSLICFFFDLLALGRMDIWISLMNSIFGDETTNFYQIELYRNRVVPIGCIYLLSILPVYYLFIKKFERNFVMYLLFFANALMVVLSNYRSMVLVFLLGLNLLIYTGFKFNYISGRIVFNMLFLILFGVVLSNAMNIKILNRFILVDRSDINTISSRLRLMKDAIFLFKDNFLTGVGWGNFSNWVDPMTISYGKGNSIELVGKTHNMLLTWLSETGIIGFWIFLWWYLSFIISNLSIVFNNGNFLRNVLAICGLVYLSAILLDDCPTYCFFTFCIIEGMKASYEDE